MRMSLPATFALLGVLVCSSVVHATDDLARTLTVNGLQRSYLIHLPSGDPATPRPLLLVFHGGGSLARSMPRFTHLDALADRAGVIVVYPQGIGRHWNDGRHTIRNKVDDVAFVNALIDEIERGHAVDRTRIDAAGISNGAIFVERLACELSGRIAAVAAVAGTLAQDKQPACHPVQPVSVAQFDGTADPIVPYAGGNVADFGGHGEGGKVLSVNDTTALWARVDGCMAVDGPQPLPTHAMLDPTRVYRTDWRRCRAGSAVVLYRIQDGGHTWPGGPQYLPRFIVGRASRQLDASATMLDFFLNHPRQGG